MVLSILHSRASLARRFAFGLLAVLAAVMLSATSGVSADSTSASSQYDNDQVYLTCRQKLSSKAKHQCSDNSYKLIQEARNVATYDCTSKDAGNNDKSTCVTNHAVQYVTQAANKSPGENFKGTLEDILQKAAKNNFGSLDTPSSDSGSLTPSTTFNTGDNNIKNHQCGSGDKDTVFTSLNFGCTYDYCAGHNPDKKPDPACKKNHNAIIDALFAIIRLLSDGAGLVIIGSLVVGGIQYTMSRGDPQANAAATNRLRTVVISLLIFIFAYAILNYLIPGSILR